MRVFLDAGILFSASRSDSLMGRFIARLAQTASLHASPYAVEEALRNLRRKFPEQEAGLRTLLAGVRMVDSFVALPEVTIRDKDRPIIEGAVAAQCTHLLTSDRRDFGIFFGGTIHGTKVVSPQLLADELVELGLLERQQP